MPPSVSGSDYSFSLWLYVKSSNYGTGKKASHNRDWKTIMYRENGEVTGDNLSVQPGVWLSSDTNRILIRWETVGRVKEILSCCKPEDCKRESDIGRRCQKSGENTDVQRCIKNNDGGIGWNEGKIAINHNSMDPNMNPPSKRCNSMADTNDPDSGIGEFNNESCVDNIPLDRWFQLVIATHENSADVYIDGKLVNTITFDSPPQVSQSGNLVLSKDNAPGVTNVNHGFSGAMTQVRYFSRAIGPYEILKIYSWGPHPFQVTDPDDIAGEWNGLSSLSGRNVSFSKTSGGSPNRYYGFSGN